MQKVTNTFMNNEFVEQLHDDMSEYGYFQQVGATVHKTADRFSSRIF